RSPAPPRGPATRRVRCGQRSAPIQPCSTATTGSATSASASSHATRRRKALTGRLLRRRRDSGFGIRDSARQAHACGLRFCESRIPKPESRRHRRRRPMSAFVRLVAWLLALALVALPVVAVLQGWIGADRWPLRTLRVVGTLERVDEQKLREAVLPYARNGFFAVRLEDAQAAVAKLPWVERAEVRKQWPDVV